MKIIHTDNYGGDYPDEQFVTEIPSMNKERMQSIADAINKAIGLNAYRYYEVVEDDYKLSPGFEP
jgi:hypothetical protein